MTITRRTLLTSTLAAATTAGFIRPSALLAAPAPAPYQLPLSMVHPELRPMVAQIAKYSAGRGKMTRATVLASRAAPEQKNPFAPPLLTDVAWERRMIPVGKPYPDVPIYIINAKPGTIRPAILHTHGGGYIMGSAKDDIRQLQDICKALDCVAVSVDYRLAPEATYKGSIEDNYAGLKWLHANADALGADRSKIAVYGGSAGGGHAAILAITARDRGEVPLCFQCLIYPMLDDRTGSSVQKPPHVGTIIWTPEQNRLGWDCFLGQKPGLAKGPLAAIPARNPNLKGLPPAFIGVGTLDLFCDEDIDYGQRLSAAGVMCETIVVQGAFHGFDFISKIGGAPLGKWFDAAKLNALRRGFGMTAL
jgi:acetyl esterase/lipase